MDEVSFGPKSESRLLTRHRRAFAVGGASAIVAGVAVTMLVTGQQHIARQPASAGQPTAHPAAAGDWLPVSCPPVHAVRPSLAGLPVGMRPGASQVIAEASFAGYCVVLPPTGPAR
jgi:hypothetical protein